MKASETSASPSGAKRATAGASSAPAETQRPAKSAAKTLQTAAPAKAAKPTPAAKAAPPEKPAQAPKVEAKAPPAKAAAKPTSRPAPTTLAKSPARIEETVTTNPKPEAAPPAAPAPIVQAPVVQAPVVQAPVVQAQVAAAPRPAAPPQGRPSIPGLRLPPPRVLGREETFTEGDYVVYPTHGVGKVEKIATEEIAGHKLELIHITFEENRMTLRVPVAKARTAGLRRLATRKSFDEALAVLKGRARVKRTMWSRRAQEYEAKINSGDPIAIAEVVRDLHRNAGQPDQSFSERQIYEAAMDRLAAELAALEQIDKMAAVIKLATFLKAA